MLIRKETLADYDEVYAMVKRSFATADHSDGTEQDYLTDIRKKSTFLPELSLVAQIGEKIVGQIVLYKMQIHCGDKIEEQLVLSPLSVHVDYFGQGIGAALIAEGCKRAREHGYRAVFLCGDPAYYSRFGFVPTHRHRIYHVNDSEKNASWCMVKELEEGCLEGVTGIVEIE